MIIVNPYLRQGLITGEIGEFVIDVLNRLRDAFVPAQYTNTIPSLLVPLGILRGIYRNPNDSRVYRTQIQGEFTQTPINDLLMNTFQLDTSNFLDSTLCPAPEHTISLAQTYYINRNLVPSPWRVYYMSPAFRNETSSDKHQIFTQLGVEIISDNRPEISEISFIINRFSDIVQSLGIEHTIHISCLTMLTEILRNNLPPEVQVESVLLIIDGHFSLTPELEELLLPYNLLNNLRIRKLFETSSETIFIEQYRETPSFDERIYNNFVNILGISNTRFSPFIVRGLDYYEGIAFEILSLRSNQAIAGGGQYLFGGPVYGFGGAFGIERLINIYSLNR